MTSTNDISVLLLEVVTQTANFRHPDFQNFHKTLPLPPPTTLVGFAGAALGLGPLASQQHFDKGNWHFGVYGTSSGKAKDLWKYRDAKQTDPAKQRGILKKEILFDNRYLIAFGNENKQLVLELANAFDHPKFALTLGNSDSLAKIIINKSGIVNSLSESDELEHCLAPGNVLNDVIELADIGMEFSIYTTADPVVNDLPVAFSYDGEYGVRKSSDRNPFSFIGERMKLNYKMKGVWYKDVFIPLFPLLKNHA